MSTITQLTSALKAAIPGIHFGTVAEKTGRADINDPDSEQVVIGQTVDVFVGLLGDKKVGTAGWRQVYPNRWNSKINHPEFFVEGPRMPRKKNVRWVGQQQRRESKHADNLIKFATEGFRVDNPEEVFEGLRYTDETYQDARRKAGDADRKLINMLRHLDEEVFAQLMNLVRVHGNVGDDLTELLHSYDEAIGQLDENKDIMNRRVETLREKAGVV